MNPELAIIEKPTPLQEALGDVYERTLKAQSMVSYMGCQVADMTKDDLRVVIELTTQNPSPEVADADYEQRSVDALVIEKHWVTCPSLRFVEASPQPPLGEPSQVGMIDNA